MRSFKRNLSIKKEDYYSKDGMYLGLEYEEPLIKRVK